ncbi:hypothetical protein BV410_28730 [Klebsiella pneumoniae]|nr:hypothetical protein BV410_28730 [Klebsiella pneumoniae]
MGVSVRHIFKPISYLEIQLLSGVSGGYIIMGVGLKRHNLNLRQHLARLGRKSLSFSKSVELHDKVIGHYLNIKHYQ